MVLGRSPAILDHLSALADTTRSRTLLLLDRHELTVSELCTIMQLPQSTVSRHLKALADSAWIAAGWLTEATGPEGRPFTRPGPGTFVLERRGGTWLAVHSHFSLLPSRSESAHGRLSGDAAPP